MTDFLARIALVPSPTILEHLSRRLNRPVFGPDCKLFTVLYNTDEVRSAANKLLIAAVQLPSNLDAFMDCFTDDVRYVTADNKMWHGKTEVRANLKKGMDTVPFVRYGPIDYFEITGNRLTIYTWNRMGNMGFPNISVFYYGGSGKFFLVEDLFDVQSAGALCRRYVWSTQGFWGLCRFIIKALFT